MDEIKCEKELWEVKHYIATILFSDFTLLSSFLLPKSLLG